MLDQRRGGAPARQRLCAAALLAHAQCLLSNPDVIFCEQ